MNEFYICQYSKCKKYLLEPVLLSCGKNVCKCHVDELIDGSIETFECFVCNQQHKIPYDGFVVNTAFNKIVSFNFHLNENEKKAADLVNQLKLTLNNLEKIVDDSEGFIFDYVSNVRNKIDLERERLINEINSLSNEMLDKLKKYEDECKQNLKNLIDLNNTNKTCLTNLSSEIEKWSETLRTPYTNKEKIDSLIDDSTIMIEKAKEIISDYKQSLQMNKICTFNPINTKFESKLFGEFYVGVDFKFHFKSSILTPNQSSDLIKLCEFDSKSQFKLIYQATKDGFSFQNFHSKCDGIPNTLIIIKVKGNSNIFGGYCSVPWDSSSGYKNDPKAFIFSLINQDNKPLKFKIIGQCTNYAIFCNSNYGLTFGRGSAVGPGSFFGGASAHVSGLGLAGGSAFSGAYDIFISNNSNMNLSSYSNIGYSYSNNQIQIGTTKAQNILAGSHNFSTEEIEVYQTI